MAPSWSRGEILAFDLETTGIDRFGDVPVSFALVTMVDGLAVRRRHHLVDPGRDIPEGATAVHGITTARARAEGMRLDDAVAWMCAVLVDATRRGVPVAGMCLSYDLTLLDACARARSGRGLADRGWWGPVLDASVLDRRLDRFRKGRRTLVDLCTHYGVGLAQAHDAAADAEASVAVLAAMARRFPRLGAVPPAVLHRWQVRWHREWAWGYSRWREENGQGPLPAHEFEWPLAADPVLGRGHTAA